MDLSKVTTVKKSSIQTQNFDLRFMHSSNRFQLSDNFYAAQGMNSNGFTYHTIREDGELVPLVSIQPNEESVFYKGKEGEADKDTGFAYSVLLKGLRDLDMISEDEDAKFDNYRLEEVGTHEGATYYAIRSWESEESEETAQADLTGATQEQEVDEEPEPVDTEEAIEEDPFA